MFLNAGRLLSANVVAAALGLVVTVLTARALGTTAYGVLALILVYELTISRLVTFNAWQALIKFGSEALEKDNRSALRQLMKFGFCLDMSGAAVGAVLAMVLAGPVSRLLGWNTSIHSLLLLYSVAILFDLSGTPIGILRLFDRFDLLGYMAILGAALRLLGVLWCWGTGHGLFAFVLAYLITGVAGQLCQVLVALWVLRKEGVGPLMNEPLRGISGRFPGIWDYVWTTNLNSTIRMMSREADEFFVAALATPAALGLFKIAKQFSQMLPRMIDPLYQSIYPELTRLWAADQENAFLSFVKRSTVVVGVTATVGWLAFLLGGRWLIVSTVGVPYSEAYSVAVVYLLALVIAMWAFSLQPAMLAMGLPRASFKAQGAATVIYLATLFPSVRFLGITGASWAYVGYYLVWTILMLCFLRPLVASQGKDV